MADKKKSSFSLTCSLLSQYVKEKRRSTGRIGLFDINIAASAAPESNEGSAVPGMYRQPATLNLLPGLDVSVENQTDAEDVSAPLTIFYGGKVMVFENMLADKVADLMKLAYKGSSATTPSTLPSNFSDIPMPVARKASLQRFIQKRKDRIIAKAPYQVNASSRVEVKRCRIAACIGAGRA